MEKGRESGTSSAAYPTYPIHPLNQALNSTFPGPSQLADSPEEEWCFHRIWWRIRPASMKACQAGFSFLNQATSFRGEAASECFCWHFHQLPRDVTLLPHLA